MEEGRAEVEILGQRIVVRGQGSPEHIQSLAAYLDAQIRRVRDQARVHDPVRLSILAGLHVADELFRCRERETSLAAQVDALVARLDRALGRGGVGPSPRFPPEDGGGKAAARSGPPIQGGSQTVPSADTRGLDGRPDAEA
jgi:cell division protein ZapA (FtsZ GTPase activity inhibitor)